MSEMLMCPMSKTDFCVYSGTPTYRNEKENHRKQKTDEKQVVKMKSEELISFKVEAGKHVNKLLLTLF